MVGPHTENFRDIVSIFQRADALCVVSPEKLAPAVLGLLQNDNERAGLGRRALEVMRSQQGATERTIATLLQLLPATSHAGQEKVTSGSNA